MICNKMATSPEVKESGRVRAQMRQVVGDLENVLGELKTVVGDLRVLVTQIDAVTDKIDHHCMDEDVSSSTWEHRRRLSAPVQASLLAVDNNSHNNSSNNNNSSSNNRPTSLRHSVSHSYGIGRRKSDYIQHSPETRLLMPHTCAHTRSQSHSQNLNKQSSSSGKHSPDNPHSHSHSHSHSRSHSHSLNVSSAHGTDGPLIISTNNNNNNSSQVNFNAEKYQLSPPGENSKDKKESSSSTSSGYATRVVGKRRKIGPKLALSLPSTDANSKVDSASSRYSGMDRSFTDHDSQYGGGGGGGECEHGCNKHVQCSPCSPVPTVDYCGIYERELDLKLELDFEYDDVLEVHSSTLGTSTYQAELQMFGLPLAPPYDHDINTWTQYTVDFINSNNYGLHMEKMEEPYCSDTASDLLSSEDINVRILPKTMNPKFVNYSWRTVVKP